MPFTLLLFYLVVYHHVSANDLVHKNEPNKRCVRVDESELGWNLALEFNLLIFVVVGSLRKVQELKNRLDTSEMRSIV